MSREYRSGEWFAVPIGGRSPVAALVLRLAPRVAGAYVFPEAYGEARASEALWAGRVYDRGLRERRWTRIGRLRGFDEAAWPAPRGEVLDAALFEPAIVAALAGQTFERPRRAIYDLQPPFGAARLATLPPDAVVQWRRELSGGDLELVSRAFAARADLTVRLYGRASSQLGDVRPAIPATRWQFGDGVRELAIGAQALAIRLHGDELDARTIEGALQLRSLTVSAGTLVNAAALRDFPRLEKLDLVGVRVDDADAIFTLPNVVALRCKRVERVTSLAALARHPTLRFLALEELTHVDDLRALATIPHLESLEISGAWQFEIEDLSFLRSMPQLERLRVDIGGMRKNAEIYAWRPFAVPPLFDSLTI